MVISGPDFDYWTGDIINKRLFICKNMMRIIYIAWDRVF